MASFFTEVGGTYSLLSAEPRPLLLSQWKPPCPMQPPSGRRLWIFPQSLTPHKHYLGWICESIPGDDCSLSIAYTTHPAFINYSFTFQCSPFSFLKSTPHAQKVKCARKVRQRSVEMERKFIPTISRTHTRQNGFKLNAKAEKRFRCWICLSFKCSKCVLCPNES